MQELCCPLQSLRDSQKPVIDRPELTIWRNERGTHQVGVDVAQAEAVQPFAFHKATDLIVTRLFAQRQVVQERRNFRPVLQRPHAKLANDHWVDEEDLPFN